MVRSRDRMTAAGHKGVSYFGDPGQPVNASGPMSIGLLLLLCDSTGSVMSAKDVHL